MEKLLHKFRHLVDTLIFLKRVVITLAIILIAVFLYQFLINGILLQRSVTAGVVFLWIFTAYLVLPRVHRFLSKIYLPNYFIGRARTGDGLLSDPVNLAVVGNKKQLEAAMKNAGWIEADELTTKSTRKMIVNSILKKSYPNAPVSSLFLFNEKQSIAFQQEVGGSTKERHHVRFWKTPKNWYLPGGYKADYLGAATYDRRVGLSLYTFQITHKIEEDTDIERDFVVHSIIENNKDASVHVVENFSTGYHTRSGGGDTIRTDGDLPFIEL